MAEPYAELIGDPVAHSLSSVLHRHWLAGMGLEGDYRAVRCSLAELPDYLADRRDDPDWRGCNVTMPLKQEAAKQADRAASSLASSAANCIVLEDGSLVSHNTDVAGVRAALAGVDLKDRHAVIIGHGGAALAARAVLNEAELAIIARDCGDSTILPGAAKIIAGASLVINATPLGMTGGPAMPRHVLDALATVAPDATAFDMVYQPLRTPFLVAADAAGLRIVDGLTMLIGQAREAFELFFGVAPPPDDAAVRTALSRAD